MKEEIMKYDHKNSSDSETDSDYSYVTSTDERKSVTNADDQAQKEDPLGEPKRDT